MAKDLVRTRRYIKKMIMMKTQIQAVSLKIQVIGCVDDVVSLAQTLKSQNAMAQAMRGVTRVRMQTFIAFLIVSRRWDA